MHYTQVTLKTFVAKSSLDDNEKKKNSRTFFLNTKPNNYYSLILLKKLKDFKDINCFKPFLYMDSGLHEIS